MLSTAALAGDGFVGRHDELAFLRESFVRARDSGARFVPVEGDAGIGKSRLIAEFAASVSGEALVARGDCSEHVRDPYGPFWPIFDRIGTRGLHRPYRARGQRPNAAEKAAFFDAALRALERSALRKPLVAVIEDLQWADSATLELLKHLMAHLSGARVMLVAALRVDDAVNPPLAAFRHFVARRRIDGIRLRGLHRNEIRAIVARHATGIAIAPATLSRIEVLSEGNPLFAEELARIAAETGGVNLATHAPLSLQATLGERTIRLDAHEHAVLVRAAILGQRFDAALLGSILDEPAQSVLRAVQRAVEAGILVEVPPSPNAFAFRHAMFRQAFADQMIVGLAAPLHARIARELETADDCATHVAELAYHWSEARDAARARHYNERAAESAWSLYAYRDAIGFYGTALRWEYPPGAARAALYERMGTLLSIEGCGEEPTEWFEKSRAEYARIGDAEGASRALLRLADQYWVDARTSESYTAAAQAATAAGALAKPAIRAEAELTLARYAITLGDPALAQSHLDAAGALRAHFNPELRACFHEVRAETRTALGLTQAALRDCRRASAIAHETQSGELIAQIENNYALVAFDLGELDLAIERHGIALAEARRTSMNWRVAYSALNFANTLTFTGELERARALVREALESGVTTATFKTKAAAVGVPLALQLGDRHLLEACADDDALALATRSAEPQRIASVSAAFAELRRAQGAPEGARALLGEALAALRQPHRCTSLALQAGACHDGSMQTAAQRLLSGASLRPRIRRACRLLIALAQAGGSGDRRRRVGAAAATACAHAGWRLHQARALEAARSIGGTPAREAAGPLALSPRQTEVARLVADGATNRAIAERLHISEHTVEHHLSTIFTRLGLHSRSALAAHVERSLTA